MTPLSPQAAAHELTVMAWRRTVLRWVVVAVVAARIFTDTIGAAVVVVAFAAVGTAIAFGVAASRNSLPDALRKPAVRLGILVSATLLLGAVALVWVLSRF